MKANSRFSNAGVIIAVGLCILPNLLWAADSGGFTRQTYDSIIIWVNFFILAGLIFKFARRPLINFLQGQSDEVKQTMQELEDRKRSAENRLRETQIELDAGQERLEQLKEKIIAEGQRRKEQIIAEAQNDSAILMDAAKHKIDALVRDATVRIREDLIDMASDIALEKLPKLITLEDQERLVGEWMEAVNQ